MSRRGCRAPDVGDLGPVLRSVTLERLGRVHLAGGVVRGPSGPLLLPGGRQPGPERRALRELVVVLLTIGPLRRGLHSRRRLLAGPQGTGAHRSDGRHGGRDHVQPAGPPPGTRHRRRAGRPGPDLQRDDRAAPAVLRGGPALHRRRRPRAPHPAGRHGHRGRGRPPLAALARTRPAHAREPPRGNGAAHATGLSAPVPLPRGRGHRHRGGPDHSGWRTWSSRWANTWRSPRRRRGWACRSTCPARSRSRGTRPACDSSSSTCSTTPSSTRRPAAPWPFRVSRPTARSASRSTTRGSAFRPITCPRLRAVLSRRSRTVQIEGADLGLAICRSIAEAHGGRLGIDSGLRERDPRHARPPRSSTRWRCPAILDRRTNELRTPRHSCGSCTNQGRNAPGPLT